MRKTVSYLLMISVFVASVSVTPTRMASAEINSLDLLERCRSILDEKLRLRCYEAMTLPPAERARRDPELGTWRLVRTPNPEGGRAIVSIMQAADPSQSDIDLAGLTLRCAESGFDVLVVFLKSFSPRAQLKVKLTTTDGRTSEFESTVVSPGAAILLSRAATAVINEHWQTSHEVAIEVHEHSTTIHGVIPLVGLTRALSVLMSNCAAQ